MKYVKPNTKYLLRESTDDANNLRMKWKRKLKYIAAAATMRWKTSIVI